MLYRWKSELPLWAGQMDPAEPSSAKSCFSPFDEKLEELYLKLKGLFIFELILADAFDAHDLAWALPSANFSKRNPPSCRPMDPCGGAVRGERCRSHLSKQSLATMLQSCAASTSLRQQLPGTHTLEMLKPTTNILRKFETAG